MRKSKWFAPYCRQKKCSRLGFARRKSGVYLIRSQRTGKIVYIGHSGYDIYKTCLRHFQQWNDKTQVRVTYPRHGYRVRMVFCTPKQAARLEKYLILKLRPKDNPMKYESYKITQSDKEVAARYKSAPMFNPIPGDAPF